MRQAVNTNLDTLRILTASAQAVERAESFYSKRNQLSKTLETCLKVRPYALTLENIRETKGGLDSMDRTKMLLLRLASTVAPLLDLSEKEKRDFAVTLDTEMYQIQMTNLICNPKYATDISLLSEEAADMLTRGLVNSLEGKI